MNLGYWNHERVQSYEMQCFFYSWKDILVVHCFYPPAAMFMIIWLRENIKLHISTGKREDCTRQSIPLWKWNQSYLISSNPNIFRRTQSLAGPLSDWPSQALFHVSIKRLTSNVFAVCLSGCSNVTIKSQNAYITLKGRPQNPILPGLKCM